MAILNSKWESYQSNFVGETTCLARLRTLLTIWFPHPLRGIRDCRKSSARDFRKSYRMYRDRSWSFTISTSIFFT